MDENIDELVGIFEPILQGGGFCAKLQRFRGQVDVGEKTLESTARALQAAELWLSAFASRHVARVPAHLRGLLVNFGVEECDDKMLQSGTFLVRQGMDRMLPELSRRTSFDNS